METSGCALNLTGFYAFGHRLGADIPLQRRILEERYGISTQFLNGGFWYESGGENRRVSALPRFLYLLQKSFIFGSIYKNVCGIV